MIVRVLGEGQWRVDDGLQQQLHTLDDEVAKALDAGDEAALHTALAALAHAVRSHGEELPPEDFVLRTQSSHLPTSRSPRPVS
jgi:hypothetical protein